LLQLAKKVSEAHVHVGTDFFHRGCSKSHRVAEAINPLALADVNIESPLKRLECGHLILKPLKPSKIVG